MSDTGTSQEHVAVTGANGFIGQALVTALRASQKFQPVSLVRKCATHRTNDELHEHIVGDIGPQTEWHQALEGCAVVIHTASRVHVLKETNATPENAFHTVNVAGTIKLAEQAAQQGTRRFIFLSSVGVHGPTTTTHALCETSDFNPRSAYAKSKLEAERALQHIATQTGMDITIVRPPLVYGPGAVPGNFGKLVRIVRSGLPLPFASIANRRSFVSRSNLVDFIINCVDHPAAANESFLVSDNDDQSTPGLIRAIADGLQRPARLWPMPVSLLKHSLGALGRDAMVEQLCGSLELDISHACQRLHWTPPHTFQAAMRAALEEA